MVVIESQLRYNMVSITFDSIPHLMFRPDSFVGLQTWTTNDRFCIEITCKGGVINTEYDTKEKFVTVLRLLGRALI